MKKIICLIILSFIIINNVYSYTNIQNLNKKITLLQQLNNMYQSKIISQYNIIKYQQQVIKLDSLHIKSYQIQINLYQKQIQNYKKIIDIQQKINEHNKAQIKWYDNKYIYYLYGATTIILSSFVVRNIK